MIRATTTCSAVRHACVTNHRIVKERSRPDDGPARGRGRPALLGPAPGRWPGGEAAASGPAPHPARARARRTESRQDDRPSRERAGFDPVDRVSSVVRNPRGEPAWRPSGEGDGADAASRCGGRGADVASRARRAEVFQGIILRKEVIQPQVPLRLPCYDLVPITGFIFGACLCGSGDFGCPPLWWLDGRCVQGSGTHSPRQC